MKRLFLYLGALLLRLTVVFGAGYLLFHRWWAALLFGAAVIVSLAVWQKLSAEQEKKKLLDDLGPAAPVLQTSDGFAYRDLNNNGILDVYEDPRQPVEARVENLLAQMTLEEKAAQMLSPMAQTTPGDVSAKGNFLIACSPLEAVVKYGATMLDCSGAVTPRQFAEWQNEMQHLAERTRLGIPLTMASDPRHTYVDESNPLANMQAKGVSSWPIPLGMAAARSEELTAQYAQIVRKELTAMGVRFALHPVMDTATEPRWGRTNETYGDNADLNAALGARYILGLQTEALCKDSVACCSKHFPAPILPDVLRAYGKKFIESLDMTPMLPAAEHRKGKADFTGDWYARTFEAMAEEVGGMTDDEIAYCLGNQRPSTFGRHYCDYEAMYSLVVLKGGFDSIFKAIYARAEIDTTERHSLLGTSELTLPVPLCRERSKAVVKMDLPAGGGYLKLRTSETGRVMVNYI